MTIESLVLIVHIVDMKAIYSHQYRFYSAIYFSCRCFVIAYLKTIH